MKFILAAYIHQLSFNARNSNPGVVFHTRLQVGDYATGFAAALCQFCRASIASVANW